MNSPTVSSPRILVVDDNRAIHDDFRKILGEPAAEDTRFQSLENSLFDEPVNPAGRAFFRIDSAYQGQEALEMVERAAKAGDPYALAFVDIRMPPGWDGVETIERLWRICPDLQAVICTAFSDYSWEGIIHRLGHADNLLILKKPFENMEVLQAAHAMTRKWMLERQTRFCMTELNQMVEERTRKLQQEVAEHVRTQEALKVSEERFSKAFQFSPMPMAIQRRDDGRFLAVNDSFLELTDRSPGCLLQPDGPLCLWEESAALEAVLRTEEHLRNHSCVLRRGDGKTRNTLLWTEPVTLDEQPCRLMVVQDVTDRLKLEAQLRQAQKLEIVGRLVACVAHEFNNVLTVIQGHAAMLHAKLGGQPQPLKSADRILQASHRAANFTRQLLGLTRQQPVNFTAVNLSGRVRVVQKMLEQSLGERFQLKLALTDKLPLIRADEGNVEEILMNLALNARDAMPDGGDISISTRLVTLDESEAQRHHDARAGQFVRLTVSDQGCGISPEMLERIFDPFFTTKEVGKGTGLGLSMVLGIVRQHRGWVEVESEPGRGAAFNVFFPIWEGACPEQPAAAPDTTPPCQGRGETVLLVEDEPVLREMMRATLEGNGYRMFEAADGSEALALWDTCPANIDLVVTDVVMPNGMSGGELARQLQARAPGLKVICTSGYTPDIVERELPANHGIAFLPKPYLPHKLLETIRQCLDERPEVVKARNGAQNRLERNGCLVAA